MTMSGMPLIMGILNATPDSFSDGGQFFDQDGDFNVDTAITRGLALAADGADVIDVGGESTRPGAQRVESTVEMSRVIPVVEALAAEGITISVDTMRPAVAQAACAAGAQIVNDVSGGRAYVDQQGRSLMARVVADAGTRWILMHWREHSATMRQRATYQDVVREVREELSEQIDVALEAGVSSEALLVDPGLGFAKKPEDDWAILRSLSSFVNLGLPLVLGASRKSFLEKVIPGRSAPQRDAGTLATSLYAAEAGVWGVRVHNVRATADAFAVAAALR